MSDYRSAETRVPFGWEAWRDHAACGDYPTGTVADWYAEGDATAKRGARLARALELCNGCPVREPCLAYALANGETFGVWGGLTPRERHRLAAAATA